MTSLTIRPATPNDCGIILSFIEALADYEKLRHEVVANEAKLSETLFGDSPQAEVLIAEHEGKPAGFALFFHNYSTFLAKYGLYLEDLFVLPEMRGKGIGKALLTRLAHIACERNCGRLEWSVLDWNIPAIDFYESLDAEAMDGWTTYRLTGSALKALAEQVSL